MTFCDYLNYHHYQWDDDTDGSAHSCSRPTVIFHWCRSLASLVAVAIVISISQRNLIFCYQAISCLVFHAVSYHAVAHSRECKVDVIHPFVRCDRSTTVGDVELFGLMSASIPSSSLMLSLCCLSLSEKPAILRRPDISKTRSLHLFASSMQHISALYSSIERTSHL